MKVIEITWKEYCMAKEIVAKFDKHRDDIRKMRRSFNWDDMLLHNIIWRKRYELNKEMYEIRNATIEQIDRVGMVFIEEHINNLKIDLLKLRLRAMKNVL